MTCPGCGADLGNPETIGRRDSCPGCGADLHACRNCAFFERGAHNDCREPNAERVVDKERSNFCEYFSPAGVASAAARSPAHSPHHDLDRLFGGKGTK